MNPLYLKRTSAPKPLSETAAQWVLRAERGLSDSDEKQLRKWLAEPAHSAAYENELWGLDAVQRHAGTPELLALRDAALSRRSDRHFPTTWATGIAAAAAVFISLFVWLSTAPDLIASHDRHGTGYSMETPLPVGVYRTGVGERSAVVLPDGSVATLDTGSQLRVAYSSRERGVYLIKGQALFEVAKGRPIPFEVYAHGERIVAVGTTFNVRIRGDQVQVSMLEGVVKVRPTDSPPNGGAPVREVTLRAGESLASSPGKPAVINSVNASQVAAWRGGLLVFEDEKLSDAIVEINRYAGRPVRLADNSIGNYRVTGVFKTNDPGHFATAMTEVFPLEIHYDSSGAPVLAARR